MILTASLASVATALMAVLVWLCRNWIDARLKGAVAHEYARSLAEHKDALQRSSAESLERARADWTQARAIRAVGEDYLREAVRVAHGRRIDALEALWMLMAEITNAAPELLVFGDVMSAAEWQAYATNPKWSQDREKLDAALAKVVAPRAESAKARLLAGEEAHALFVAYRTVVGRAIHLIRTPRKDGELEPWFMDSSIHNVVASALGSDQLASFKKREHSWHGWLRDQFEQKFIEIAHSKIAGTDAAVEAAAHARAVEDATRTSS